MNQPAELASPIADLLARAGIDAAIEAITPCARGGNNRIYRVDTAAGVFAAKQYFRHEGDTRDRLAAEYAFLDYANHAAPGMTPRPFACNSESGLALYEFVEGRPLRPDEIGPTQVGAAIQLFRALNAPAARAGAQLPIASEACFSLAEHVALIRGRIDRLLEVAPHSDIDAEALDFFHRLDAFWRDCAERIRVEAVQTNLDFEARLPAEQRCISPSDFGFHNALATEGGSIRFLDFEYAGWDDPAKTAGDFFAQLALPVPPEFFANFVAEITRDFPGAPQLSFRAALLQPAYQVKWCCIALNVFLPVNLARRRFANPGLDETALKRTQLEKGKQLFQSIQVNSHGLH